LRTPLGKYAVARNHDYELEDLSAAAALGGRDALGNSAGAEPGGDRADLAGMDGWRYGEQDVEKVASAVRGDDCAILLSHNPDALPSVPRPPPTTMPLGRSGPRGHTHGGQVTLFGRRGFTSSIYGNATAPGGYEDEGVLMMVANGIGTYMARSGWARSPGAFVYPLQKVTQKTNYGGKKACISQAFWVSYCVERPARQPAAPQFGRRKRPSGFVLHFPLPEQKRDAPEPRHAHSV
jgi:hypothetical protein